VGQASGISNMARYVGTSLLTAAAATIYGSAAAATDVPAEQALVDGVRQSALLMAVISGLGILLAVLHGRFRPRRATGADRVTAAAGFSHTVHPHLGAPASGGQAGVVASQA
jgi:hypothetical protein